MAGAPEHARFPAWQSFQSKLIDGRCHDPLPIIVSEVSPSRGDFEGAARDECVVGDGDAAGVDAEIAKRVFGAAEGLLGVGDAGLTE